MIIRNTLLSGVAVMAVMIAPAAATQSVTSKTSTVNPDGSVSYQSETVVTDKPVPPASVTTTTVVTDSTTPGTTVVTGASPVPVTFYYFDPVVSRLVSTPDLSQSVFNLWDDDKNKVIDMNEFYRNKMVMYEPVEYSKRTYQDIDADGDLELTQNEYTVRFEQLPLYSTLNRDRTAGVSLYEFLGTGFQSADRDDSNNLSYPEFRDAFYGQTTLTAGTGYYNGNQ